MWESSVLFLRDGFASLQEGFGVTGAGAQFFELDDRKNDESRFLAPGKNGVGGRERDLRKSLARSVRRNRWRGYPRRVYLAGAVFFSLPRPHANPHPPHSDLHEQNAGDESESQHENDKLEDALLGRAEFVGQNLQKGDVDEGPRG